MTIGSTNARARGGRSRTQPGRNGAAATFARGMADKPRVQAPKQRTTSDPGAAARKRRNLLLGAGGLGLLLVAVVAVVALAGFGGTTDARPKLEAAGCTLQVEPAKTAAHSIRDPGASSDKWNTDPPTNGPHYGVAAIFGSYAEPLEQARVIHDLEHGGIFIQYGAKVPEATVLQLRDFYADHKPGTILAPLPRLGEKIALGAWVVTPEELAAGDLGNGYLATCTTFDDGAFSAFFDEFQFRGSHGNDPAVLQPGH